MMYSPQLMVVCTCKSQRDVINHVNGSEVYKINKEASKATRNQRKGKNKVKTRVAFNHRTNKAFTFINIPY